MILQKKTLPAHFFNDLIEKCPAKELFPSGIYFNLLQQFETINRCSEYNSSLTLCYHHIKKT